MPPNALPLRCAAGGVEEMLTVDLMRKVRLFEVVPIVKTKKSRS